MVKKISCKVLSVSLVSTFAIVLVDCFCRYYSKRGKKKKKAIWTNLSPDLSLKSFRAYCLYLQRTVLAYPLGICQLSSAHQSKYWGGWSLTPSGSYCPNTSASGEKKLNFLLSMKQELGNKPSEMKSVHRGRLEALGVGITA